MSNQFEYITQIAYLKNNHHNTIITTAGENEKSNLIQRPNISKTIAYIGLLLILFVALNIGTTHAYTIHNRTVVQIDLNNYYLKTWVGNPTSTVLQKNRELGASVGINGSFFCPAESAYRYCGANNSTSSDRIVAGVNYSKYPNDTGERGIIGVTSENKAIFVQNNNRKGYMANSNQDKLNEIIYGIGNFPILVDKGKDVTSEFMHLINDSMMRKGTRSFACIDENGKNMFMGFVPNRSMYEMGKYLINQYNCHYAINLDAGGSSALVVDDKHIIGPGRRVVDGFVAIAKPEYIESKINNYKLSSREENAIKHIVGLFHEKINEEGEPYKEKILNMMKSWESSNRLYPLADKRAIIRRVMSDISSTAHQNQAR